MSPVRGAQVARRLPTPPTEFIGRQEEVAKVSDLVLGGRLTSLCGPGGIGKTRLALQVAESVAGAFPDGVHFVPLADVALPEHVPSALAAALDVAERPGRDTVKVIAEELDDHRVLLVIDNFEHVVDAAPVVSRLLADAPGAKALVTSRERLHLYGERVFQVPALPVPEDDAADSTAVRLYVARARDVDPGFRLRPDEVAVVAELCRRLDGLPLAIELAAARSGELSAADMVDQLGARLDVLGTAPCDRPARQATLRNTIAWSYDRLRPDERRHFDLLGAFVGGAPDEALPHVVPGFSAAVLAGLADKSLLNAVETAHGVRWTMLDSLRAYALERLAESDAAPAAHAAHAAWMMRLLNEAQGELSGPRQLTWLDRLDAEHPNLRAALHHALSTDDAELTGRMCAVLWRYWLARSHYAEGRSWLDAALYRFPDMPPALRAELLNGAGALTIVQSDFVRARRLLSEGLALARGTGDERIVSRLANNLAHVTGLVGDHADAVALYEENLARARRLGDRHGLGVALGNLGDMLMLVGEVDRAAAMLVESIAVNREIGHVFNIAIGLHYLGEALLLQGRHADAESCLDESLALGTELRARDVIAACHTSMGALAIARGDNAGGLRLIREGLRLAAEMRNAENTTRALEELALALHGAGDDAMAVRAFAAAATVREAQRIPRPPVYEARCATAVEALRGALGAGFAEAWAAGSRLTPHALLAP